MAISDRLVVLYNRCMAEQMNRCNVGSEEELLNTIHDHRIHRVPHVSA